jgi:hypothetical protein
MSNFAGKGRLLVYLLPSLHVLACLATVAMGSDWKYVGLVDYPVSIAAVGLAWHYNWPPVLLFGILGTLWWYLLSRAALFVVDKVMRVRGTNHG